MNNGLTWQVNKIKGQIKCNSQDIANPSKTEYMKDE